jgi:hypothetical protein
VDGRRHARTYIGHFIPVACLAPSKILEAGERQLAQQRRRRERDRVRVPEQAEDLLVHQLAPADHRRALAPAMHAQGARITHVSVTWFAIMSAVSCWNTERSASMTPTNTCFWNVRASCAGGSEQHTCGTRTAAPLHARLFIRGRLNRAQQLPHAR